MQRPPVVSPKEEKEVGESQALRNGLTVPRAACSFVIVCEWHHHSVMEVPPLNMYVCSKRGSINEDLFVIWLTCFAPISVLHQNPTPIPLAARKMASLLFLPFRTNPTKFIHWIVWFWGRLNLLPIQTVHHSWEITRTERHGLKIWPYSSAVPTKQFSQLQRLC